MSTILILGWTILLSLSAVGAAWYARRFERADALIALYVLLVVAANLVAQKIVGFDLGFTSFFAPAATLIFSHPVLAAPPTTTSRWPRRTG